MQDWPAWLKPATEILRGRDLEVRVGLEDHGRVVAELEAHLLARGPRPDAPPDVGGAGEGDHRDVRVVDERVADGGTAPGHDVQMTRGQVALVEQELGERDRRQRGLARGLEHHGAAGRDGGRELVRHQVQREVERADGAHHADRHPQRERELSFADVGRVHRDHLAGQAPGLDRGERERGHRAPRLDARGLDRLCGFLGDDARERLHAVREEPRGAVEDLGAPPRRQRSVAAGRGRGGDGSLDVGFRATRDAPDLVPVERRTHLDAVRGREPFAADRDGTGCGHGVAPIGMSAAVPHEASRVTSAASTGPGGRPARRVRTRCRR